jgi:hypothetical protein
LNQSSLLLTITSQNLDQEKKNINNTMSIVIEFIANTNYEIQIWIVKTCGKIYTHKTKEHRILEAQKIRELKMLKPKRQIKTQNWVFFKEKKTPLYDFLKKGSNIYPS